MDVHLVAVVGILVAVDWLILLPWSVFHPLQIEMLPVRTEVKFPFYIQLYMLNTLIHNLLINYIDISFTLIIFKSGL